MLKRYILQIRNTKKKQTRTEWISKQTEAVDTKQQNSENYNQAEVKDIHEPLGQTHVVTNGKQVVIQCDDHREDDIEPDFLVNYDLLKAMNQFEPLRIQEGKSPKKLDKGKTGTVTMQREARGAKVSQGLPPKANHPYDHLLLEYIRGLNRPFKIKELENFLLENKVDVKVFLRLE